MTPLNNQRRRRKRGSSVRSPLLSRKAVHTAREALVDSEGAAVGEHLGVQLIDRYSAVHRFAAYLAGYEGWEWHVVVARAAGAAYVTVSEIALQPADKGGALKAPEWVPWFKRVQQGDLRPGDIMPPAPDDERLTTNPAEGVIPQQKRAKGRHYLSASALQDAESRWRAGDYGPQSEFARKVSVRCASCAFYVPVAEPLGPKFGVCTNEVAADGHVVAHDCGCGAHSEIASHDADSRTVMQAVMPALPYDDEQPIFGR